MRKEKIQHLIRIIHCICILCFMLAPPNLNAANKPTKKVNDSKDVIMVIFCRTNSVFVRAIGQVAVAVAVLSAGMGLFFGKASWVNVITIIAGIGLIFGAGDLVETVLGGEALCPKTAKKNHEEYYL